MCAQSGVQVAVVDMPSIDEDLLLELCESGKLVCLAEQNNGYILQNLLKVRHRRGGDRDRHRLSWQSTRSTGTGGRNSFIPEPMKS